GVAPRMGVAVEFVLLAAAWFGHAFLWTVILNLIYSQAIWRWLQKRSREVVALCVFGFPLAFGAAYLGRLRELAGGGSGADLFAFAYLSLCWAITFVYVPVITFVRSRRRPPPQVVAQAGCVVDIADRLGEKPVGDGKNWRLSLFPGNEVFTVELREVT